eukprot:g14843.t1
MPKTLSALCLGVASVATPAQAVSIVLGPADTLAVDQPRITFGLTDESTIPGTLIGPPFFNSGLLDTGANGILLAGPAYRDSGGSTDPTLYGSVSADLDGSGVIEPDEMNLQYAELGVAGTTLLDLHELYGLRITDSDGVERLVNPEVRAFGDSSLNIGSFGAVVGMPAMQGFAVEVDMRPNASLGFQRVAFHNSIAGAALESPNTMNVDLRIVEPEFTDTTLIDAGFPELLPTFAGLPVIDNVPAAAFLVQDVAVDLSGGHVVVAGQVLVEHALVGAQVHVGLEPVVEDEDLAVAVGVERARVDVEVAFHLDRRDAEALVFEQLGQRGGEDPLAQAGHDGLAPHFLIGLAVLCCGCQMGPGGFETSQAYPPQIGAPRPSDLSDADPYERVVAQIVGHLEDGALVLAMVEDAGSARLAAGMFIEASDRVLGLRSEMLDQNPRDALPPRVLAAYGPRYFFARIETERQLDRIRQLPPEVHEPLDAVLKRLDGQMKQLEKQYKEREGGGQQGG